MVELFFHLASKWPKWCAQTMHPFSQIATIFPRIGAPIVAVSALVGLVTLTFDPESGAHYCSWGGQSSYQFWCSKTFRSRLIGQHLSDTSRDLATLTFDLGGHGAWCWCGSSCSVCLPSLKFVGLPFRKILGIYCVSFNPPGDLDLSPFDL